MNKYLLWVDKKANDETDWELAGTFDNKDDAEVDGLFIYDEAYYWFVEEVNE